MTDSVMYGPTVSINGSINGHPVSMLVDTGSAVTILHANAWKLSNSSNSTSLREPERPVIAANGENLALLGKATVSVQIGKTCVQHLVLVADNLMQECLLGADFLTNKGCIVDLQRHVMITRGEEIPLQNTRKEREAMACHVGVSNTITIPVRHQVWLEAELASSSMHDCMDMMEPEPKFVDMHGLYVAHSLSMNRNGFITVQVLNPTFAPIVVYKSEKLGIFQLYSQEAKFIQLRPRQIEPHSMSPLLPTFWKKGE